MSDLVEGLRKGVWGRARRADAAIQTLMQDGADRIEAQAARIAELEAAQQHVYHIVSTGILHQSSLSKDGLIELLKDAQEASHNARWEGIINSLDAAKKMVPTKPVPNLRPGQWWWMLEVWPEAAIASVHYENGDSAIIEARATADTPAKALMDACRAVMAGGEHG